MDSLSIIGLGTRCSHRRFRWTTMCSGSVSLNRVTLMSQKAARIRSAKLTDRHPTLWFTPLSNVFDCQNTTGLNSVTCRFSDGIYSRNRIASLIPRQWFRLMARGEFDSIRDLPRLRVIFAQLRLNGPVRPVKAAHRRQQPGRTGASAGSRRWSG